MNIEKNEFLFTLDYKNRSEIWAFVTDESTEICKKSYASLFFNFLEFDITTLYTIIDDIQALKLTYEKEPKLYERPHFSVNNSEYSKEMLKSNLNKIEADAKMLPDILTDIKMHIPCLIVHARNGNKGYFDVQKEEILNSLLEIVSAFRKLNIYIEEDLFGEKFDSDSNENRIDKIFKRLQAEEAICRLARDNLLSDDMKLKILPTTIDNHVSLETFFTTTDYHNVLKAYLVDFIQNNVILRKCRNCNKPFIVQNNSIYCDRIVDSKSRTCKQVGAIKQHKINIESDVISNEYKKAYAKYYARYRKNSITKVMLDDWRKEAKLSLQLIQSGNMSEDDFLNWVKK